MTLHQLNRFCGLFLDTKSSFGCVDDVITLSCANNKSINVMTATYGTYNDVCDTSCCAPNPLDCTEVVSENNQADWIALKVNLFYELSIVVYELLSKILIDDKNVPYNY